MRPGFAQSILRAVVPCDVRFPIHILPVTRNVSDGAGGAPVFLQIDIKRAAGAIATLPTANVVAARGRLHAAGSPLVRAARRCRKLHPLNVREVERLPMAILEHDDDGARTALRRSGRRNSRGNVQKKNSNYPDNANPLAHEYLP